MTNVVLKNGKKLNVYSIFYQKSLLTVYKKTFSSNTHRLEVTDYGNFGRNMCNCSVFGGWCC